MADEVNETNETNEINEDQTTIKSTLEGIKCPPNADSSKAKKKRGASLFVKKWLKQLPKYTSYSFSGKQGVVGNNYFRPMGKKCSNDTEYDIYGTLDPCYNTDTETGEDMYTYIRGYPPKASSCKELYQGKNKKKIKKQKENQGIMAGIGKDFEDIDPGFLVRGVFGSGHLGNNKCVKVGLPVGTNLDDKSKEVNPEGEGDWQIEHRCVPDAPSMHLQYGKNFYEMPYSGCDNVEEFQNLSQRQRKDLNPIFWGMIVSCMAILLYNTPKIY